MQNSRTVLRAFGDKLASAVFIGILRTVNLGNDDLAGSAMPAIQIFPDQKLQVAVLVIRQKMAGIVDRATVHRADVGQYLLLFTVAMVLVIDEAQRQKR